MLDLMASAKMNNMFKQDSIFIYLIQEKYSYWTDQTSRNLQKLAYIKHGNSTYLSNIEVQESTSLTALLLLQASSSGWTALLC